MIEVVAPGLLATVQDLGRPGYAALGVPRSGAADRASFALANRLVGNDDGAPAIEATMGGLVLRFDLPTQVAVTGAPCFEAMNAPVVVGSLALGVPDRGLRTYVAVRGGIDVPAVLGSRSTDTLSALGPAPLRAGDRLPVGASARAWPTVDVAPVPPLEPGPALRVVLGPRHDWCDTEALCSQGFSVTPDVSRVGLRLDGVPLRRVRGGELLSEGTVAGALQVPPDGRPVLLLADHPTTGGYPVVAVVVEEDLDRAAQLRPGDRVRFRAVRG